ncbi:MAG: ferritin-like domain-containing protein [Actinomycetota bacterium]|nr:ferritin-like domain-containing protein [Actinomycetota bacterium]MDA3004211.1 ferritin-like domain-containing protein [Actinomycetota bacterium]
MLSDDDINLLVAAHALELAARDIYAIVVSRKSRSDDEQGLLALMHSHHVAYEQTINGVLGKRAATERNNEAYNKFFVLLSDASKLWETLLELENTAIATHTTIISRLTSAKNASLLASITTIEARHAAMLATRISTSLDLALENTAQSLVTQ